jgi:hypothetical protein
MDRLYQSLPQSDFILEQWKKYLVTLGQWVQVNQGDAVYRVLLNLSVEMAA